MTALVLKRESDNYWNLIKDASSEVKLVLIKRLSDALRPAVAEKKKAARKKADIDKYYGIWSDDEFMDADELVKFLHDSRLDNPKRGEFVEKFFTEEI